MERQARRAQVLRHAKRIFARKGYHRTNIADIITRARIARGTFYLYFENKRDLFEELLDQVVREVRARIKRIQFDPEGPSPVEQLSNNLRGVLIFLLAERELTDILLNHSRGFDRELDARIDDFYERIARQIQRSLNLGIELDLVRRVDTRMAAFCILGAIKELVGQLSREPSRNLETVIGEILGFGLRGVAGPKLLAVVPRDSAAEAPRADFSWPQLD